MQSTRPCSGSPDKFSGKTQTGGTETARKHTKWWLSNESRSHFGGGGSVGSRAARTSGGANVLVDTLCLCSRLGGHYSMLAVLHWSPQKRCEMLARASPFGLLTDERLARGPLAYALAILTRRSGRFTRIASPPSNAGPGMARTR
jgi:hypothetical protein